MRWTPHTRSRPAPQARAAMQKTKRAHAKNKASPADQPVAHGQAAQAATERLVAQGVLHPSYTADELLNRFHELCDLMRAEQEVLGDSAE